ncbi:DNRLRE domain-containing protein [Cystobacter fuscus]
MRGWKVPVSGALAMGFLVAAGCGSEWLDESGAETEFSSLSQGLTSTSFQDGVSPSSSYAGTRDAMIEEEDTNANHGSATSLSASGDTPAGSGNENYILLRWDVSSIPANATIRSASIVVTVSDKADQSYDFYELTRDWNESRVTWEQADSNQDWASNGADGAGDRNTASLGSIRASATGTYTVTLNAQGLEVVRKWVANPSSNHGVIVANKDNDNRLEIRSSEYSTKTSRPKLTVSWEVSSGDGGTDGGAVPTVARTGGPGGGDVQGHLRRLGRGVARLHPLPELQR